MGRWCTHVLVFPSVLSDFFFFSPYLELTASLVIREVSLAILGRVLD